MSDKYYLCERCYLKLTIAGVSVETYTIAPALPGNCSVCSKETKDYITPIDYSGWRVLRRSLRGGDTWRVRYEGQNQSEAETAYKDLCARLCRSKVRLIHGGEIVAEQTFLRSRLKDDEVSNA